MWFRVYRWHFCDQPVVAALALCLCAVLAASATAAPRPISAQYMAAPENADWAVVASQFECSLRHEVPFYGAATFKRRAGETPRFELLSQSPKWKPGQASVVSRPPVWRSQGASKDLGYAPVTQGRVPLRLDQTKTEQLLSELHRGQELVFTRAVWYGGESSSEVVVTGVNFQKAYRSYLGCLGGLLPVNYDQVARTSIYFPPGDGELPAKELRKLDNIAIYVKADPSVISFVIDGHTDSAGPRGENLELSQFRAEMVMEHLVQRGISADKITPRWHGERYPVASNRSAAGRAKNRRVTVRLVRDEDSTPTTLAQSNLSN